MRLEAVIDDTLPECGGCDQEELRTRVALLKDKYLPFARNFFGSFLKVITAPLEYDPICNGDLFPGGPFSIEADIVLVV